MIVYASNNLGDMEQRHEYRCKSWTLEGPYLKLTFGDGDTQIVNLRHVLCFESVKVPS